MVLKYTFYLMGIWLILYQSLDLYKIAGLPRIFTFSKSFKNPLTKDEGDLVMLKAKLLVGCRSTVGGDYGVDVYGAGRRIDTYLKDEFGWGSTGLGFRGQDSKYIRAHLYLDGHSVVIPWDTHKNEYRDRGPVGVWLYQKISPILRKYQAHMKPLWRHSGSGIRIQRWSRKLMYGEAFDETSDSLVEINLDSGEFNISRDISDENALIVIKNNVLSELAEERENSDSNEERMWCTMMTLTKTQMMMKTAQLVLMKII